MYLLLGYGIANQAVANFYKKIIYRILFMMIM